jgi:hypothetical protein
MIVRGHEFRPGTALDNGPAELVQRARAAGVEVIEP